MKIAVGELRRLIREEVEVVQDPFADPNKKKAASLPELGRSVLKAEELLGSVPGVLKELEASTRDPKAKEYFKKGAGLAYHAMNDLKALEAVLTVAVKQMKKN